MDNPISSTMQLAQVLKGYRKKSGMSQTQAGNKAGLQQKTVSALEKSPASSRIGNMFKLLYALNLEIVIRKRGSIDPTENKGEW